MSSFDGGRKPNPFADLGMGDAGLLLRRTQQFHRLAERLRTIGKAAAAKHGIGPLEYDNILGTRVTEVAPNRVDELWARFMKRD